MTVAMNDSGESIHEADLVVILAAEKVTASRCIYHWDVPAAARRRIRAGGW